ncbi:MAG: hypothetical protein R3B70_44770 [Polyangiaceae bacterium]
MDLVAGVDAAPEHVVALVEAIEPAAASAEERGGAGDERVGSEEPHHAARDGGGAIGDDAEEADEGGVRIGVEDGVTRVRPADAVGEDGGGIAARDGLDFKEIGVAEAGGEGRGVGEIGGAEIEHARLAATGV